MGTWPQVSIDTKKGIDMCFGCGQNNHIGLKLNFRWDSTTARAEFTPSQPYQGWSGIVHGGIIACLLDEAMGYVSHFQGITTVTAKMQMRLRQPALIGEPLVITASMTKKNRKLVEAKADISLRD
ncbi:PaaI family thioesterase, partial [Chloroflexota bacterium]